MSIQTSSVAASSVEPGNQATRKHLRGSSLLLVGRVIAMATNFAVQVLTVRYLSKSDYGAFAYVMSLASLGASLAVFGLDKTITRFIPIYQEKGNYQKLFGAIIMMIAAIISLGSLLVLLVFGLQSWIASSFIHDELALKLLLLLIFLSPIDAFDSLLVGMLAIFASPKAIFFRRHVLGPGLKLLVIILLILLHSNVYFLAAGYVIADVFGAVIYTGILLHDLRKQGLAKHFNFRTLEFPLKEVFGFTAPLFTTNIVYLVRSQLVIVMLEYFRSTLDVAAYRAVQPVADLNTTVIQSFAFLFMPMMARMFAKKDQAGIDDLYWHSAIWITVITFPIFLVTFSLAQPLTVLLFGQRYAQSGTIMALLAIGYYFNAALGFNADTLRIYGKLGYTVAIDFLAMLLSVGLTLLLIPRFGAIGAALGTCGTLIIYNILNHLGLKFTTPVNPFKWQYWKVYVSVLAGTLGLAVFQKLVAPPIYVGVPLAGAISLLVLFINRNVLSIEQTFPELLRFQVVRFLFANNRNPRQGSDE